MSEGILVIVLGEVFDEFGITLFQNVVTELVVRWREVEFPITLFVEADPRRVNDAQVRPHVVNERDLHW